MQIYSNYCDSYFCYSACALSNPCEPGATTILEPGTTIFSLLVVEIGLSDLLLILSQQEISFDYRSSAGSLIFLPLFPLFIQLWRFRLSYGRDAQEKPSGLEEEWTILWIIRLCVWDSVVGQICALLMHPRAAAQKQCFECH